MPERDQAPGELAVVERFLNTRDVEAGRDELREPDDLRNWLLRHELIGPGDDIAERDLARARDFREALRDLLLANHGERVPRDGVTRLNQLLQGGAIDIAFTPDGRATLVATGRGVQRALAGLAAISYSAMADGRWARLKVCLKDSCRWAFYDRSKNRSRSWCSMAVCGNRVKAKSFRARSEAAARGPRRRVAPAKGS